MVEANIEGDGIVRPHDYAKFRDDKPAEPGFSRELINSRVDPKYYDNLEGIPYLNTECETLYQHFKKHVAERPNDPFMGTRRLLDTQTADGKPMYGDYEW